MRTHKCLDVVLIVLALLIVSQAPAQWQQTKGPSGGKINIVWALGSTLFAGTDFGVYRSTDKGGTWVSTATGTGVYAFINIGTTILAGTADGVYRTTDNGVTWDRPSPGLQTTRVNAFAVIPASGGSGAKVFAGTEDGIFRSTDGGVTWTQAGTFWGQYVCSLAVLPNAVGGTTLIAGCASPPLYITDFHMNSQYLYDNWQDPQYWNPADPGDMYSSSDEGASWVCKTLSETVTTFGGFRVTMHAYQWVPHTANLSLQVSGNRLFTSCFVQIQVLTQTLQTYYLDYKSDTVWRPTGSVHGGFLSQSGISNGNLFLVDHDGFLCQVDSSVATLENDPVQTVLGFVGDQALSLARIPGVGSTDELFVATNDRGILKSTDDGKTWNEANSGMIISDISALTCMGKGTTSSAAPIVAATSLKRGGFGKTFYGMYRSTNQGTVWSAATSGPAEKVTAMISVPIGTSGQAVLAGTSSGLYRSTDGGATWNQVSIEEVLGLATAVIKGTPSVFAVSYRSVSVTTDMGGTWRTVQKDRWFSGVFTSTDTSGNPIIYVNALYPAEVERSTDNGTTWQSLFPFNVNSLATRGTKLFAATSSGVCVVDDQFRNEGQVRWTTSLPGTKVNDVIVCGTKVFAAVDSLGVFISTDDGGTWIPADSGLSVGRAKVFASDGTSLYLGTAGGGVFRYTGSVAPDPSIAASSAPSVPLGTTFWVNVNVGDPDKVTDLWDIWFDLVSSDGTCTYVDSSAKYGSFLTQGFVPTVPQTVTSSADPTLVHIYIKRMSDGVSGSGIVARAQFKTPTPTATTSPLDVTFSVKNIVGRNSKKVRISFHPATFTVHLFLQGINVWPGDCNGDNTVNANDILSLGLYYNATGGKADNPGILWQAYERQRWTADDTPKRVHADANGDGVINSADLLAIGLNYGKTHTGDVPHNLNAHDPSLAKTQADGQLSIASAARESGVLRAQLRLSTMKPVYGIGFTLKYSLQGGPSRPLRYIQADTGQSVLGGGLFFSRPFDAEGRAEIAITRTDRIEFTGDGALLNVSFEVPAEVEDALRLEICQVVANDAKGNPVSISGSVYQNTATGVLDAVPLRHELYQNYPNPFNPSTLIRFDVSSQASVSLKIYDVLGRELTVLANGILSAGRHSAVWDASSYPSGVYFCVLRINEENKPVFVQTRRMTLVK